MSDPLSELLQKVRFSASVFFRAEYCGNWAVDTSGSRQVPFHLVTHGEGWLHTDGESPTRLMTGHLVLFPNDAPHVLSASEEEPDPTVINAPPADHMEGAVTRLVCGYFSFDEKAAAPLLASLPGTMLLNLSDASSSGARELVQLWMREAAENALGSDVAVDRFAELVFIQALRCQMSMGRLTGVIGALADKRLGPILGNIHRHPGAPHTLKEMASSALLSESAFTQRFKKQVGMTPGNYVRHWRMQSAARLLTDTDLSMGAIAERVGYESEVAFRKAFSTHFEQTPGRYRRGTHSA
ncbi:MAG: AraC family transcriptional regulator [Pseudomonadota bacterium]